MIPLLLLVLFITKSALDHAWHLSHTRCVPRISTKPFVTKYAEPHNSVTLTQWPFYILLLLMGVSPWQIMGTAILSYNLIFQPIINAAHGHPYFYKDEIDYWVLFGWRIPKLIRGRGRIGFATIGFALLWL